jgi:hypothetical protein
VSAASTDTVPTNNTATDDVFVRPQAIPARIAVQPGHRPRARWAFRARVRPCRSASTSSTGTDTSSAPTTAS